MTIHEIANVSLETPHIPLGIGLREALNILGGLQVEVVEEVDRERCFRVVTPSYSVAIYPEAECVRSITLCACCAPG